VTDSDLLWTLVVLGAVIVAALGYVAGRMR